MPSAPKDPPGRSTCPESHRISGEKSLYSGSNDNSGISLVSFSKVSGAEPPEFPALSVVGDHVGVAAVGDGIVGVASAIPEDLAVNLTRQL